MNFDKRKANLYPFIFSYCRLIHSSPDWTYSQIDRAIKDGAPYTSMYYSHKQEQWVTLGKYNGENTKGLVLDWLETHPEIIIKDDLVWA